MTRTSIIILIIVALAIVAGGIVFVAVRRDRAVAPRPVRNSISNGVYTEGVMPKGKGGKTEPQVSAPKGASPTTSVAPSPAPKAVRRPPISTEWTKGPAGDRDADGIKDDEEARLGTSPTNKDSDGDGMADAEELFLKSDPKDPRSLPPPEVRPGILP